jgi:hypothetical protein
MSTEGQRNSLRSFLLLPGEFETDFKMKKRIYLYAIGQGLAHEEAVCLSFLVRNKIVFSVTYDEALEERISRTMTALDMS